MVATNAFGMGIDKSNVNYLIHYNKPKSLEAYYQGAGRAGRDGEKADCILLYSASDIHTAKFLIQNSSENDELSDNERQCVIQQDYKRLDSMIEYSKTTSCLRGAILEYFGQKHGDTCQNCSNCCSEYINYDITKEAQMILSCVKRIKDRLGYSVGATVISRTLHGSKDKRIIELGVNQLSTYGLLKTITRSQIRDYIEHLESRGYLRTDPVYGSIELTTAAGKLLFHGEHVSIPVKKIPILEKKHVKRIEPINQKVESDLFIVLKSLRYKLAQEENVPAYIIFSNANLVDMARKAPKTMSEFMNVSGVGDVKASRYGEVFLKAIAEFAEGGRE
jgi:ATP-dependent DNA helicase RecQ